MHNCEQRTCKEVACFHSFSCPFATHPEEAVSQVAAGLRTVRGMRNYLNLTHHLEPRTAGLQTRREEMSIAASHWDPEAVFMHPNPD